MEKIVQILIDNKSSWMLNFKDRLEKAIELKGWKPVFLEDASEVKSGKYLFLMSCVKIVPKSVLELCEHSFVIHASNVPKGRGCSPITWSVLKGENDIVVSLFEAAEKVDSGPVYKKESFFLNGTELIDEIRAKAYGVIENLVLFVLNNGVGKGNEQVGNPTYLPKRAPIDSELDANKSIAEQFNLLRVVDNERYPAFFKFKGKKFVLKIYKE